MPGPVIWIEGIIGSGKTTLTEAICKRYNLRPIHEPVDSNPYLAKFYKDPKRWAYAMQIYLLHYRYRQQNLAAYEAVVGSDYNGAVIDRGLPGDRVFARLHVDAGNIDPIDWDTYEMAYETMACSLRPPSLLLYLDVRPQVALERIRKRGRECERDISINYLKELSRGYDNLLNEIRSGNHAWSRGISIATLYDDSDAFDPSEAFQLLEGLFPALWPRAEKGAA